MMGSARAHLLKEANEVAEQSADARIAHIRAGCWIPYPRANEVLARLQELLEQPKRTRMPNALIIGHTNNGKSSIIERFINSNPAPKAGLDDYQTLPILAIEMPPIPRLGALYNEILLALDVPFRRYDRLSDKRAQVLHVLELIGIRVLIIDEIQHLLSGQVRNRQECLNAIKELGNKLRIPIVAAGVKEAVQTIHSDPQMANRFEPLLLPKWKLDRNFLRLLKSFEERMPLRCQSDLPSRSIAPKIFDMTDGILGEVASLVERAAVKCIKDGTEQITKCSLESLPWTPPNSRRRIADSIDG